MLEKTNNNEPLNRFNKKCQVNINYGRQRSVAMCLEPYDKIVAIVNKTRVRDQEEKNKIFNIY